MKKTILAVVFFFLFFVTPSLAQEVSELIRIRGNTITVNGIITEALDYGVRAYIAGDFHQVSINNSSPTPKSFLSEILNDEKIISPWDAETDGNIEAMIPSGKNIIVAGHFTKFGGKSYQYLTSFDANTHEVMDLGIKPDGPVYALQLANNILYIGGGFTEINGQSRMHLASIDLSTNQLTNWNPDVNDTIFSMTKDDNTLYVGGAFTQIQQEKRARLAAFDLTDGSLLSWNPDIKIVVRKISTDNGKIAVEGYLEEGSKTTNAQLFIEQQTGKVISEVTVVPSPTSPIRISPGSTTPEATVAGLMVNQQELGFKIPTLSDILTFAIRGFFVIAGLAALFYMLLGAFAWVTSGGDKDAVSAARDKIQSAIVGVLVIVGVLAIVWTLEQVIFSGRICFGISCPVTLPTLIQPI